MPTMESLTTEFAVIDANHAIYSQQVAEIELLRILLRESRASLFI